MHFVREVESDFKFVQFFIHRLCIWEANQPSLLIWIHKYWHAAIFLTSISLLVILEPAEGPDITSVTPTATTLKLTWNKLNNDDSNGEITKYQVFYQLGSTVSTSSANKTVTGVDNTMVDLTGLKPATMYTVAVRAFTKIGPGPLGDPKNQMTNESCEFIFHVC
jgi:hypothetical protein